MLSTSGLFLVATLLSNMLFGIFVNIAVVCLKIFYRKIKERSVNNVHLASFITITVLCVVKVVMDNVVTVRAFSNITDGDATYPAFSSPTIVTLNALWVVETLVADAFITYRLWIVYHRKTTLIIFPSILLVGCLTSGIYNMYIRSTGGDTLFPELLKRVNASATAFTAITLALNAICTGLISYRIWHVRSEVVNAAATRATTQEHNDPVRRITTIIIESAAIYTVVLLLYIILIATHSPLSRMIVPLVAPLIAVVFGSIIVRSASGVAVGQTTTGDYNHPSGNTGGVYELRSGRGTRDERLSRNPTSGLQVTLNTVVTSKVDGEDSVPYGDHDMQGSGDAKYPQV